MGESFPGPESGSPGPVALGGEPWQAPRAGPGSLVLPWALFLCGGVADLRESVRHTKKRAPPGDRDWVHFHGPDLRDPVNLS